MSWFAKRPLAQSRAAVLCSLLPWPEDAEEQERVKAIIRESLNTCQDPDWTPASNRPHAYGIKACCRSKGSRDGYDAARADVLDLLAEHYPDGAKMLDPFSGRGLIPVEAARFGIQAHAIDYSPVAALASRLLIDWPFRNWNDEPDLPFDGYESTAWRLGKVPRLVHDIEFVQERVGRRSSSRLSEFFPEINGVRPWAYLWVSVIPCSECGRSFPLYGNSLLQGAIKHRNVAGQSMECRTTGGDWSIEIVSGASSVPPTTRASPGKRTKRVWCPFPDCGHSHEYDEHRQLSRDHYHSVQLVAVGEHSDDGKHFRKPAPTEVAAAEAASAALDGFPNLNGLPATPDERIGRCNAHHIAASNYGAKTWGDLCVDRQNLLLATYASEITAAGDDLLAAGVSLDYVQALTGYCGAALVRKIKRSTRGASVNTYSDGRTSGVNHIFSNESSMSFNYDSLEVGISGEGSGTWEQATSLPPVFEKYASLDALPGQVQRGSALALPFNDDELDAIVTDPPYDAMIDYADVSDLWFVWLRRALGAHHFDFAMTTDPNGGQEKAEEIIVKDAYTADPDEHRTPAWYDTKIREAFVEHARAVHDDGVVSIVFGHNDPGVWERLLGAVSGAGLVLTGAWPANTEKGGQAGSGNINTTLTLACRPAPANRPDGDYQQTVAEIRGLIKDRVETVWNPSHLSYVDQKMAAVGPAMEVVGRYARVLDIRGHEVPMSTFLPIARQAVTDAWDFRFNDNPLEVFDRRTQFALEWVLSYGRSTAAGSEARWQRLSSGLDDDDTRGLLQDVKKPNGVRLAYASEAKPKISTDAPLIDVALAMAHNWQTSNLNDTASAVHASGHDAHEPRLWALVEFLASVLPDADKDASSWSEMLRNRAAIIGAVTTTAKTAARREDELKKPQHTTGALFEEDGI